MDVKPGCQMTSTDFYVGTCGVFFVCLFLYPGHRSDFLTFHSGRKTT